MQMKLQKKGGQERKGSGKRNEKKKREGSRKQRDKSVRDTQMGVDNEDDSERTRQKLVPRYSAPAGKPMPDYIMGPQAHVLHVEHAMESPHDPRPNAFYDNDNGVMRVYHGPAYGNPVGVLYPKLVDSRQQRPLITLTFSNLVSTNKAQLSLNSDLALTIVKLTRRS